MDFCGREGAGKTTAAKILTNNQSENYEIKKIKNRIHWIVKILFDIKPESNSNNNNNNNLYFGEAEKIVKRLIDENIDVTIRKELEKFGEYDVPDYKIFNTQIGKNNKLCKNWIELSLAFPLKVICSVIFDIDIEILLARTSEMRTKRNKVYTRELNKCGKLNVRECLEYVGTNIFRKKI